MNDRSVVDRGVPALVLGCRARVPRAGGGRDGRGSFVNVIITRQAGRREWIGLAVLALPSLLYAMDLGLFTRLHSGAGLGIVVTGSAVFSLALAPVDTLATDLAVGAAPPERSGAASALSETSAEFGGALGIAILGVIGTSIYRSRLTDALPAGTLPAAAADARDTIGGAMAAAGHLPGQPGQVLLRVARQAFTQGLHAAFATSAAAVLAAAIPAAIQLRHLRPSSEPEFGSSTQDAANGHLD